MPRRKASLGAIPSALRTEAKRVTVSSIAGILRGTSCHVLTTPYASVPLDCATSRLPAIGHAASANAVSSHPHGNAPSVERLAR